MKLTTLPTHINLYDADQDSQGASIPLTLLSSEARISIVIENKTTLSELNKGNPKLARTSVLTNETEIIKNTKELYLRMCAVRAREPPAPTTMTTTAPTATTLAA